MCSYRLVCCSSAVVEEACAASNVCFFLDSEMGHMSQLSSQPHRCTGFCVLKLCQMDSRGIFEVGGQAVDKCTRQLGHVKMAEFIFAVEASFSCLFPPL